MLFFYLLAGTCTLVILVNMLMSFVNWLLHFLAYKLTPRAYYIISTSIILIGGILLNIYIINTLL